MHRRFHAGKRILLAILLLLLGEKETLAMPAGYDFLSLKPATDGGNYFSLWGAKNIRKKDFVFGNYFYYSSNPLQLLRSGARLRGVVDQLFMQEFHASYGIIDRWLSAGVNVPVAWSLDFLDPNVALPASDKKTAFGDIRLHLKTELMDMKDREWGIALIPFLTIPTGSGDLFLGSKSLTGGGLLALEFEPNQKWSMVLNAGVELAPNFQIRNANKNTQLMAGIGGRVNLSPAIAAVAELISSGRISGLYQEEVESPLETRGGLKWGIPNTGLTASLGGGAGIIRGSGAPTFRVFSGLIYSLSAHRAVRRKKALEYINNKATLFFGLDKKSDGPENEKVLKKVAAHIKKGKLKQITVKGYADKTGHKLYNLQLSRSRADQTAKLLLMEPLPENTYVNTKGYGYRFYRDQKPDERCALNERCVLFEVVE